MKWKQGVDKRVKPETAYWMAKIEAEFQIYFFAPPMCTSAYREGDPGAHGRGEAFDFRRLRVPLERIEDFCRCIQGVHGRFIGVVLEPEWGKGEGYTAPHIHLQLKDPALWSS